ncbi:uncharacterized protein LOC110267926 [Arachis ipaensis]|uniref:uncharacterized protein LOC110267926 n=1 Tax=Arachis ipaensis TaxID=130454 RepID=UPI000A2B7AF3|nr:uncharacterized protein LOC110267926 [Arachis ipaensis]
MRCRRCDASGGEESCVESHRVLPPRVPSQPTHRSWCRHRPCWIPPWRRERHEGERETEPCEPEEALSSLLLPRSLVSRAPPSESSEDSISLLVLVPIPPFLKLSVTLLQNCCCNSYWFWDCCGCCWFCLRLLLL